MNTSRWRIIFFGTPSFAVLSLESLLQGSDDVIGVVTQPDRGKGRGKKVFPSPVKEAAQKHGLIILQPERVKEEPFQKQVQELEPDLFVVVAYGQILPKSFLEIPRHGAINVHASLLPKYRGAAPIPWVILKGEKVTGVTTMMMDPGMDTGEILLQAEVPIGERETYEILHDRLSSLGARLLIETVAGIKAGTVHPRPQDESQATYAPTLKKEEGRIDWEKTAEEIDRQVRAFNPWPAAFTQWEGRLLKVCAGEARQGTAQGKAGEVVWLGTDFIEVMTGKGSFLMREVQLEGGRKLKAKDFLSGHPISVRTTFG